MPQLECCHILIPRLLQFVDKIASHCQILASWMHFLQLATKFMQTPLKIYSCFPFHFQFLYFCRSFFACSSQILLCFFHFLCSSSMLFQVLSIPFDFLIASLFSFQFPFIVSFCLSISLHVLSFLFNFLSISFHILSFPFNFLS